jgi:hypothetical protein
MRISTAILKAVQIIGLVVGVLAIVVLCFALADPMSFPAPREAPVPLSSVIGD